MSDNKYNNNSDKNINLKSEIINNINDDKDSNSNSSETKSSKSKKSIFRWNAIIPFIICFSFTYVYFYFFFDLHLKNTIEWAAFKTLGSELNIKQLNTSFIKGRIQIFKIELTDKKMPEFNSIEFEKIAFDINWDALLRLKFVIEEVSVEGVQFMSKRKHIGKVAKEEPSTNSKTTLLTQIENKALNKFKDDNKDNILGELAIFLKNDNLDESLKSLQNQIPSKKMLEDLNTKWSEKKTNWNSKINKLPTNTELNLLKEKFSKIKYKDFKTPSEFENSLKEFNDVKKEIETKNDQILIIKNDLNTDLKGLDQDYKNLDLQIKKDIIDLKQKFKIPNINASNFIKELFKDYLSGYINKFETYKKLAEKYLPPKYSNLINGKKTKTDYDDTIQPHIRSKGISYEFPIFNGYPLFWIQKVKISSTSNANTDYGDFKGLITNITSNQSQIGKATEVNFQGDLKSKKINGIKSSIVLNNIKPESLVNFKFEIGKYPIEKLDLIKSSDGNIQILDSTNMLNINGQINNFKTYNLKFENVFNETKFKSESNNSNLNEILNSILLKIKTFNLQAEAKGEIEDLKLEINSNLGSILENSFKDILQIKLTEANHKIELIIAQETKKLQNELEKTTTDFKNNINTEINKSKTKIEEQQKILNEKIEIAKNDLQNKAKNKINEEANKSIEDLKKKLGF